jgi:osmotically-inducible protein OsmY
VARADEEQQCSLWRYGPWHIACLGDPGRRHTVSKKRMMSTTVAPSRAPIVLALALLGAAGAGCRTEREKAEGAVREQAKDVREQAKDVREQAGKLKEERRELGGEQRELDQRQRDAWTQAAKSRNYQVEFNPDGSVVATKAQPATGTPPPDETLRQAVIASLGSSDQSALKTLNVTAQNGVVTLRGSVPSIKEATAAVDEAMKTAGVSRVVSHVTYGS